MHKGNNRAYVTLRDESRDISGKWEVSGMNFVVPVTPEFSVKRIERELLFRYSPVPRVGRRQELARVGRWIFGAVGVVIEGAGLSGYHICCDLGWLLQAEPASEWGARRHSQSASGRHRVIRSP